jgi:hypothetical protein
MGLTRTHADLCVYHIENDGDFLIMTVSVDDLAMAHNNDDLCGYIVSELEKHFELKDLGELDWILGMGVTRDGDTGAITVDQATYCNSVLDRFGMASARPVATPAVAGEAGESEQLVDPKLYRSMVGALMYLSCMTRPDISFAVGHAGRFSAAPTDAHMVGVKRIMRYLAGTRALGITFHRDPKGEVKLVGYCDADFANCAETRKSVTGVIFFVANGPVVWISKIQPIVTLSSTEAELVSLTIGAQTAIWCRGWLAETGSEQAAATLIWEDNQSTISLSGHPRAHGRTKHIAVRWFFCREARDDGVIDIAYCPTTDMLADMLTKAVTTAVLLRLRNKAMGNL